MTVRAIVLTPVMHGRHHEAGEVIDLPRAAFQRLCALGCVRAEEQPAPAAPEVVAEPEPIEPVLVEPTPEIEPAALAAAPELDALDEPEPEPAPTRSRRRRRKS